MYIIAIYSIERIVIQLSFNSQKVVIYCYI